MHQDRAHKYPIIPEMQGPPRMQARAVLPGIALISAQVVFKCHPAASTGIPYNYVRPWCRSPYTKHESTVEWDKLISTRLAAATKSRDNKHNLFLHSYGRRWLNFIFPPD